MNWSLVKYRVRVVDFAIQLGVDTVQTLVGVHGVDVVAAGTGLHVRDTRMTEFIRCAQLEKSV